MLILWTAACTAQDTKSTGPVPATDGTLATSDEDPTTPPPTESSTTVDTVDAVDTATTDTGESSTTPVPCLALGPSAVSGCPEALHDGTTLLAVCTGVTTQADGVQVCTTLGYDGLAAILDLSESDCATALLGAAPGLSHAWIGATDASVEGAFVWPDGSPVGFTNWNAGEPNDFGGVEDCVHSIEDGVNPLGAWNDHPCDSTTFVTSALCEIR